MLRVRSAIEADREFSRELHHACYRPWAEPIFRWDTARPDRLFADGWDPRERSIVELGGNAVGSLTVSDRGDHIFIVDI